MMTPTYPKQPTPAASGTAGDKRAWECSVPEISIQDVDDEQVPEMPNLESVWAKSFQSVRKIFFLSSELSAHLCICLSQHTLPFLNELNL